FPPFCILVELESQPKKPLHAKNKSSKQKSAISASSSQEPVATTSQGFKKLKKDLEEKETGSSIGTRKKADLEASKSKSSNSGKPLKKSASLEDFKSKDATNLSASKKSLVM